MDEKIEHFIHVRQTNDKVEKCKALARCNLLSDAGFSSGDGGLLRTTTRFLDSVDYECKRIAAEKDIPEGFKVCKTCLHTKPIADFESVKHPREELTTKC